jgi:hypothetical protein
MAFTVVPIHNLHLPTGTQVDFGAGFVFQDMPQWVKNDKMLEKMSGHDQYAAGETDHAWVCEYPATSIGEPDPDWRGDEKRSIQATKVEQAYFANLALWLARPSIACFTMVFHAITHNVGGVDTPLIQQIHHPGPLLVHEEDFHGRVTVEDLRLAAQLHKALVSIPRRNPIWTAIRAFWQGVTMNTSDLRCALYWLGLEALFGPEGNSGELRYRISLRIAYFLSNDPNEAQPLARQLRKAYDMRSKVVHGRWNGDPEIDKVILETEGTGRMALIKILKDPQLIQTFSAKGSGRDDYLENLVFRQT